MEPSPTERLRISGHAVAEILRRNHPDLQGIYVYGSVGRGDATATSDLDLHVVLPDPPSPPHRALEHEGVAVDISYHASRFYERDLAELIASAEGLDRLTRAEAVWEAAEAYVLHDPQGIVQRFLEAAAKARQYPELVQRRATLTLQDGFAVLRQTQRLLGQGALAHAVNLLYRLTGGMGPSGVLPLALRGVVQLGGEALSTRRLFLRARTAAQRLGFDLSPAAEAYGCRAGQAPASRDELQDTLRYLFDVSRHHFENSPASPGPLRDQASAIFTDVQRERGVASVAELYREDPVACTVFTAGIGQTLLGLDPFPHPWLETAPDDIRLALILAAARLVGIMELGWDVVAQRVAQAEAVLTALRMRVQAAEVVGRR